MDEAVLLHQSSMQVAVPSMWMASGDNEALHSRYNVTSSGVSGDDGGGAVVELESLCTLLEIECSIESNDHLGGRGVPGESYEAGTSMGPNIPSAASSSGCGLDNDVLLNKAFLTLALAGAGLWDSPHFLCR